MLQSELGILVELIQRLPYESSEECDYLDGVLAATILQMMNRLNQVLYICNDLVHAVGASVFRAGIS